MGDETHDSTTNGQFPSDISSPKEIPERMVEERDTGLFHVAPEMNGLADTGLSGVFTSVGFTRTEQTNTGESFGSLTTPYTYQKQFGSFPAGEALFSFSVVNANTTDTIYGALGASFGDGAVLSRYTAGDYYNTLTLSFTSGQTVSTSATIDVGALMAQTTGSTETFIGAYGDSVTYSIVFGYSTGGVTPDTTINVGTSHGGRILPRTFSMATRTGRLGDNSV